MTTTEDRNLEDDILDDLVKEHTIENGDAVDLLNCSVVSLNDEVEGVYELRRLVKHYKKGNPQSEAAASLLN